MSALNVSTAVANIGHIFFNNFDGVFLFDELFLRSHGRLCHTIIRRV